MATEDEIVRRVITECIGSERIECSLRRCQKANACRKHEYIAKLEALMTAIDTESGASQ